MGNSLNNSLNQITCLPIKSCLFSSSDPRNSNDPTLSTILLQTDGYIQIIEDQRYFLEKLNHQKTAEPPDIDTLKQKMAEYYGVRLEDIRFVEMEHTSRFSSMQLPEKDPNNPQNPQLPVSSNSFKEKYYGFTIRGKKQGYGH